MLEREKIRIPSPEELKERELAQKLKEEGGILYREEKDPNTGETRRFINILGVEVETYASREDVEAIKKEIVLSETDAELLRLIAECYKLREPLMLEGDPGSGKTFLLRKFVQLIHGKNAPNLVLFGSPRTSELEILGHWAPAPSAEKSEDPEVQNTLRRYEKLYAEYQNINNEYNKRYNKLSEDLTKGNISKDEFDQKINELNEWYKSLLEIYATELQILWQHSQHKTEWEFKEGALLQAYSGRGGKGYILIVDEFNLIPPNYQQIFLQIGGEKGILSDSISFFGNSGKTVYPRGQDTWICFVSNFPEKTPGRSEVVRPLTDRLVWKVISAEETEKKEEAIIRTVGYTLSETSREIFTKTIQERPEIMEIPVQEGLAWREVLDGQLRDLIGETLWLLHREFKKYYQQVGDSLSIEGQKRRRIQQLEFSARNALRLYNYLDHFQVRDEKTGMVDFTRTLKNAYKRYYVDRLANPEARELMEKLFDEIMTGDTGKIRFKVKEEEEGKLLTRKQVLDILVERASLTPEELEKREKEREEYLQYQAEDIVDSLLRNPNIPDSVKKILRGES